MRQTHYPPDAVLTVEEVAAWLDTSERTVKDRLPIRRIQVSPRKVLYFARDVYEYLEERVA